MLRGRDAWRLSTGRALLLLAILFILPLEPAAGAASAKLLVAHRGASAYAPEHTLAAYQLALDQGADFVEQDLALTKDGVLICLHDTTLERTTNVEDVYPDRFVEDRSGPHPSVAGLSTISLWRKSRSWMPAAGSITNSPALGRC
jgi:glycerophosphoryl diester phosphodiesterase